MRKSKENIGLDIGNHSIKVVSVNTSGDKPQLNGYNIKQFPLYDDKSVKVGEYVKDALREMDAKASDINISVSGSDVVVRFITLPRMNKEQMDNALSFEAEKYIPFNINDVILDSVILDNAAEGKMNVLLAAAKSDFVHSKIDLFQKLGISINLIDINAFSSLNAFLMTKPAVAPEKAIAFFDIGHSQTNVLIVTGEVPRFMRVIQMGGGDITNTISGELGISPAEAEALKFQCEEDKKEKMKLATGLVLDELVKELKLSFNYFESKHGSAVDEIYASGGVIYQEGVLDYIKECVGKDIKTWDPLSGLKIASSLSREVVESIGAQLAVSIGLALRN